MIATERAQGHKKVGVVMGAEEGADLPVRYFGGGGLRMGSG